MTKKEHENGTNDQNNGIKWNKIQFNPLEIACLIVAVLISIAFLVVVNHYQGGTNDQVEAVHEYYRSKCNCKIGTNDQIIGINGTNDQISYGGWNK